MKMRRGFTLIELLVVISIIALLVGILLPALGAARRSAQRLQDLSNLRQFTVAHTTWAVDNKGNLPQSISGFGSANPNAPVTGWYRFELFEEMVNNYAMPLASFGCISYDEIDQDAVEAAENDVQDKIWINWMYYGGLNINPQPGGAVPGGIQVDVETNEEFNFPTTMDDLADTETLAICSHGVTSDSWGSWLPHLNGTNDRLVINQSTLFLSAPPNWDRVPASFKPDGFHVAYRDGSANWKDTDELAMFKPKLSFNSNAYYYDKDR